jgi:hypothetical protein
MSSRTNIGSSFPIEIVQRVRDNAFHPPQAEIGVFDRRFPYGRNLRLWWQACGVRVPESAIGTAASTENDSISNAFGIMRSTCYQRVLPSAFLNAKSFGTILLVQLSIGFLSQCHE